MEQKVMCIMMGKGESYHQPCEAVTDSVDKQRARGDVNEKEHKINKAGLSKGTSTAYKQLRVSKEVPTKHHCGKTQQRASVPL